VPQVGNPGVEDFYGGALFYDATTKRAVLRALADVETQTDRPLGKAGPLTNIDSNGRVTLRQGWASYGSQLFYLIGQRDRSQELLSYDLSTGLPLWRMPAAVCTEDRQEPEGLEVVPHVVLKGGKTANPTIDIGYTCRVYSGSTYTMRHHIKRLRDPDTRLTTDAGLYVVDPAKVAAGSFLEGLDAAGNVKKRRRRGERLWIEVTTFGTYYSLDCLLKDQLEAADGPSPTKGRVWWGVLSRARVHVRARMRLYTQEMWN
jgi:hypothetical protein